MHRDEAARSQAAEMHPVGMIDELGDRVLPARDRRYRGRTAIRKTCTAAARAVDTPQAPWGDSVAGWRGGASAPLGYPARYEAAGRCSPAKWADGYRPARFHSQTGNRHWAC